MGSIVLANREAILKQVAEGRRLVDIARELGLSGLGKTISDQLSSDPDYQLARESGLASRLDARENLLETCDVVDVPRARELLSHARWRCEREAPKVWGNQSSIGTSFGASGITINIGDVSQDVAINGQCLKVE